MTRRSLPTMRSSISLTAAILVLIPALASAGVLASDADSIALAAAAASRAAVISAPWIHISPATHDFGTVPLGQTASRTYTVTNAGDQNLTVTDVTSSDPQYASTTAMPFTVPPAGQSTVSVRFAPSAAVPSAATLTFHSNGANDPFTVQASGAGTTVPTSLLGAGRIVIAPIGEAGGDQFGKSVAGVGDVNGDGLNDLLVTAWASNGIAGDAGRAYLFLGGTPMDDQPDLLLNGEAFRDNFGTTCAGAGDFNGDGYGDFIVGAWLNDAGGTDAGRAYLYFGGPNMDAIPDRLFTGAAPYDNFGVSVSGAGDVNGDGYDDVIVGAHTNDSGGSSAGRAYVYFGGPAADQTADVVLTGAAAEDRFGFDVGAIGDVNGDGFDDVAVGAHGNDAGGPNAGRVYVYFGGVLPDPGPDWILTGETAGDQFGHGVAPAGNVNADGFADLLVGANFNASGGYRAGRAYIYHGGSAPDATPDAVFTSDAAGAEFGSEVASLGDLNGDGYGDVLVGAWRHPAGGLDAGRAFVYFGGAVTDPTPDLILTGERPGDLLGQTVAGLGDVTGDGAAELAVGAYYYDTAFGEEGRAYVVGLESVNRPPILAAPAAVFGAEGVGISFGVSAADPEGEHVSLGIQGRPAGALFIDQGDNTGSFAWTPGFGQAGTYEVTFTGRDASGVHAAPKTVTIAVDDVNRAPTASTGGPYAGVINAFLAFDGTASSDPDGDPLSFEWSFGDGFFATGPTPAHAYELGGVFTVTLRVSDGEGAHAASTTATIQDVFAADASLDAANRTIRLQSGKSATCVQVEPVRGAYANTNVDLATVAMVSVGTGSVDRILAVPGKTAIGSDRDRDGIDEITACFAKQDLRRLFDGLTGGRHVVGVAIEGDLLTGGRFHATLEMEVVVSGGALAASVSPNPLNPAGVMTFKVERQGRVRVRLFDLAGRLVRTLLDGAVSGAGYHDVPVDGRGDDGARLGSGVYFYRIESDEGVATGRIAIVN
ncbi:MAG TPA: PKD domain-containing protein [Acidobacteriota bacterium]|nr:PKD domain-containing protein [Acidobacteriota bacterium]